MDRGVRLERTSQLNFGGNTDFYNMLSATGSSPRRCPRPTRCARSCPTSWAADRVHIGPSDYVPWLEDRKWAHIRLEGKGFGEQPINVELKLEVWDSPNSAGVVIDAIRCCKIALDRGLKGGLLAPPRTS
jgi:myo-inositol-1-phosphate synthase